MQQYRNKQFAQHQLDGGLPSGAELQQLLSEAHICFSVGTKQQTVSTVRLYVKHSSLNRTHFAWKQMNFISVK